MGTVSQQRQKRQETQDGRCDACESETVESRCEASKSHVAQRNQSDQDKGQRLNLHGEEVFKRGENPIDGLKGGYESISVTVPVSYENPIDLVQNGEI
jgi:hypothetical protein